MQNVRVRRYEKPCAGWAATVEPEDREWILFIPVEGKPVLYERAKVTTGDGEVHEAYQPMHS